MAGCCEDCSEVFPCFFLSCKANARVNPAKTGQGQHSSKFLCCCMYCLFCVVLCIVYVYVCTVLLPPGGYPLAVKYIISYITYLDSIKGRKFLDQISHYEILKNDFTPRNRTESGNNEASRPRDAERRLSFPLASLEV